LRFIVDSMLGDVARWLRMLGYDTLYSKRYKDYEILRIAERDDRVIITRDLGLMRRAFKRGLKVVHIDTTDIEDALVTIALRTGIDVKFKENETRCPHCNTRLVVISKAEALSLVPPSVGAKYDKFWKCPKCGKVYWQGNHWKTINTILENVNKKVISAKSTYTRRSLEHAGSSRSHGVKPR